MSTNTANLLHYHPEIPSRSPADYQDLLTAKRPRAPHPMGPDARAAQFAPYAALVGYQDIINTNEQNMDTKTNLDQEVTLELADDYLAEQQAESTEDLANLL